jgi:hypothetical protein
VLSSPASSSSDGCSVPLRQPPSHPRCAWRGRSPSGSTGAAGRWCSRWCRAATGSGDRRSSGAIAAVHRREMRGEIRPIRSSLGRDGRRGPAGRRSWCMGEFNRSSQHSMERGCDGHTEEAGVGSGWAAGDAFAWASAGGQVGASSAVLGGDRARVVERGCCGAQTKSGNQLNRSPRNPARLTSLPALPRSVLWGID